MQCEIEGIAHDGHGVGRLEGKAVFVPHALPGETVEIEVLEEKKNYARARLESVLSANNKRAKPLCPHYGDCGGCDYQHAAYDLQLQLKTRVVEQALDRIGKIDVEVKPCISAQKPWRYRNKITWHVAAFNNHGWGMGYFQEKSKKLLPVEECLLISEEMQEVSTQAGRILIDAGGSRKTSAKMTVRQSSFNRKLMLILSGVDSSLAKRVAAAIDQEYSLFLLEKGRLHRLQGPAQLEEKIGELVFRISPLSFFQVNSGQAQVLVNLVKKALDLHGGEDVLDAYCGVGTLALSTAGQVHSVTGVEAFRRAAEDAAENARDNAIVNAAFLCGSAEEVLPALDKPFDTAILDPPRGGCSPRVLEAIARMKTPRVVYVSCEPSTLARDLARFQELGYRVKGVRPLDMFPQTRHVETVALIEQA